MYIDGKTIQGVSKGKQKQLKICKPHATLVSQMCVYIYVYVYVYMYIFYFYWSFLSQPFTNHRSAGEKGGHYSAPHYHLHPLHT